MAEKVLFARLGNQNYSTWQMRMEMLLKRDELWFVVQDAVPKPVTSAWSSADQKALAAIVLLLEDSQLTLVKNCKTAKDAWDTLKKFHTKASMTSRVSLLRKICSLNMVEGGNVEEHLVVLEDLFDRLACAGQNMETSLKVAMIYRSLPESFGGLVTAMESRPDADQTIEFVKQKLIDEHLRRVERSRDRGETAMLLQTKRRRKKVCYFCRKPGHFRRNCRLLQQKKEEEESSDRNSVRKAKQAVESPICFTIGNNRCCGSWYVDSGCSSHMTNNEKFFQKIDRSVKADVVLADGTVMKSAGIGEGLVKCVDGDGRVRDITFKDVLLIPKLDCNWLSVRKITQNGLSVSFSASKCTVVNSEGKIVAVAGMSEGLYKLNVAQDAQLSEKAHRMESCRFVRRNETKNESMMDEAMIQEKDQAAERPIQEEYSESSEVFYDCYNC